jgi:general stress protein YciG
MAKDERLYARFDIGMDEHPKIMLLSDGAFRVLIEATLYSRRQLTDGFLDERVALRKWGSESIDELASNHGERPSLERVEGGWQVRDYDKHQTTTADIEAKREAGRKGGRASGQARSKQNTNENEAPASGLLKQKPNETEAKTETETETETTTSNEVVIPAIELVFDDAYKHWPKKVERKAALERFAAATKRIPADELVEHIIRFGFAYAMTTEKKFTPALGVWLSHERWTDELPTAPSTSNGRLTPMERARQTLALAADDGQRGIGA